MGQALVTGATSGIGRAIAIALKGAGHEVVAVGRRGEALAALEREHGIAGRRADLADRKAARAALAGLAPDILVNNAGVMPPLAHFCDTDEDEIDRAVTVNLSSVLFLTRLVAPGMRARGRGHIFFTGSTAGHAAFAHYAVYCATKAAIGGFAQALRLDMAPAGVRVTEIVAGRVETGLYKGLLGEEARAAMYAGNSAVQPEDVAAMVLAVHGLPASVDVARFDILPTHQATATGGAGKKGD
ncbi:SDR family oxidoreductase [Amaricoccus sp.]|uniref:SDR family oxidoreductase n=1 Tax=Amaricoccus sp. TaxID=1872485 RepID=UPI001B6C67FB|nr:SDR family oxidoreductase [Amaricoccus sp.]MBP7003542.1 SDR family oxidoreductase [Amaricoccus sp.]